MRLIPPFIARRIAHRPNLIKIIDNIRWLFFDNILRMGVGLIVGLWVARYLGPEQFGKLNFAIAFISLFSAIAALGLQEIVVRDIVRTPECAGLTLGTAAVLQIVGGLLAYLTVIGAINFLRPDDTLARVLVAILGTMLLLKASEIPAYWFESQVQSKYAVWVQGGMFLFFAAVKVVLIISDAPLLAFAWTTLSEGVLAALTLLIVMDRYGHKIASMYATVARARSLLKESWPLILSALAISTYMKIDQIMLGQMISDKTVGIYSAALRISEIWYFIPMGIVASVFPAILAAKREGQDIYLARLQKLYDLMVVISVGVALPMTFLAKPVVALLFGSDYVDAGNVLAVYIWASIFVFLGVASGKWLLCEGRQVLALQRAICGAASNVVLNLWFIPVWGAEGAATATLLSFMIAGYFADLFQAETRGMFVMKTRSLNVLGAISRLRS